MKKSVFISVALVLAIAFMAKGQTRTITGSGNWSNSGNWQGGNIGGAVDNDDDVEMDRNVDIIIQSGETYTIATFDVGRDGSLTINPGGVLIITESFDADRSFTINVDGDLIIQGDLNVDRSLVLNVTGSVTVEGDVVAGRDANVDIQGDMQVDGDLIAERNATVNVDGTLNVDGDIEVERDSELTGSGTVTHGGTCSDSNGGFCDGAPLPIRLLYFNAIANTNAVRCQWSTSTEENNDYFTVQRSADGVEYENIGTIAGSGNSSDLLSYEFVDKYPLFGKSYYRLKQTDYDGRSETFETKSVYVSHIIEARIFPNPVVQGAKLTVSTGAKSGENVTLNIYNSAGIVVFTQTILSGNEEIQLADSLLPGLYVAKIKSGAKQIVKRLIIK